MATNLYQLIYLSQAQVPLTVVDLIGLLHQARAYNRARHISGLMLYTPDGQFLQVLEGEKDAVRELYCNRIMADSRHYNVRVDGEGPVLHRSFAPWTMGFRTARARDLRFLLADVAATGLDLEPYPAHPHTSAGLTALLLDFVARHDTLALEESPW